MSQAPILLEKFSLPALKFEPVRATSSDATMVWLHGVGERGTDISLVAKYGLPAALVAGRIQAPCAVICPQLPLGEEWGCERVLQCLEDAHAGSGPLVVMGYSLGGTGILESVAKTGPLCSLHVAIAGQCRVPVGAAQDGLRFLAIQGEFDVQPGVADFVIETRKRGGFAEDVIVKGGNHYISESALWQPELAAALSSLGVNLHG
ncbi:hypothetical protein [Acidovorax sp. A1169]|uniref:hypothetical protein n=1 Tax=Acidovorax sp. A1169 TaxID=3059524 RepID=UPI002737A005|nr:hypothetical protein [Acidovorax sp. A1169]MDP4073737.1 hypothetical protein [Acidovorax sp. A1169]